MDIFAYDSSRVLRLTPLAGEQRSLRLQLLADRDGPIERERTIPAVNAESVAAIARWLEGLDARSPDLALPDLGLRLTRGHFEKGEIYYTVRAEFAEGDVTLSSFEQEGLSNVARAKALREEWEAAG